MDVLTKIVPELKKIILFYAHLLNPKLQDLKLVFTLPDEYRLLFLQVEFSKRSYIIDDMADLMLTAFAQDQQTIVYEIIDTMCSNINYYVYIHQSFRRKLLDDARNFFEKQVTKPNTFFEPACNVFITIFQKTLFRIALKTNRISVLKHMYSDVSNMHLKELLWYFLVKFTFAMDAKYMASIAINGDMATITHIFEHSLYCQIIMADFHMISAGAQYSGNLDLVKWLYDKGSNMNPYFIRDAETHIYYTQNTFIHLLRYNHYEKAQSLLALDNSILKCADWSDIRAAPFENLFSMPKIKLETYEYCMQLFGADEEEIIPREILSDEVLEKYF
jgi:hypothetical protein